MLNKIEFFNAIKKLEGVFNKELTKEQIKLYHEILSLEFKTTEEFWAACLKVARTWKIANTFPPIAVFVDNKEAIDTDVQREIASVTKAVRLVGSWGSVAFSPTVNLIIKNFGGWFKLCKMEISEYEEWAKWEFPKQYKAFKNVNLEKPLYLPGEHERSGASVEVKNFILDMKEYQECNLLMQNKPVEIEMRSTIQSVLKAL